MVNSQEHNQYSVSLTKLGEFRSEAPPKLCGPEFPDPAPHNRTEREIP
jgi:hypothetical protein